MKLFKTKNMLIQSLKGVINSLEKENLQLKEKNKMYERDIIILLDSSKELREKIRNLENNLEFVTNYGLSEIKQRSLKNRIIKESRKNSMGIDELRDRYDELDNIISSIQILTKEIKDKYYIERLKIIEFEAQDELDEITPRIEQLEEEEEKELENEFNRERI